MDTVAVILFIILCLYLLLTKYRVYPTHNIIYRHISTIFLIQLFVLLYFLLSSIINVYYVNKKS